MFFFFFFFFKSQPYVAVIGDLKASKQMDDRGQVQSRLAQVLAGINKRHRDEIAADFVITLGDEFQGLLHDGARVMHILTEIEQEMHPVKIRFGLGVGEMRTDIKREMAIGADGPAFYKAREAIDFLKENEKRKQRIDTDIRIAVDAQNKEPAENDSQQTAVDLLNSLLSLMTTVKHTWSDRQREIIWDTLKHQDNQRKAAKRLGITQPTVQKALAGGNYYAYKEAMDTIEKALKEVRKKDV